MTTLVLVMLAVLLAGPVPAVLARLRAIRRTPRAAMVLWQSVALAAVLAALGAGLSLVTARGLGRHGVASYAVAVLALLATLVVLGRLLLSGHRVGLQLRRLRRRHRTLVDLLSAADTPSARVRVLAGEVPLAYCLPGLGGSRVVLSGAAVDLLDADELEAVLAHEGAHLRARHDLVLEAFLVLRRAFPAVVTSRGALAEVRLLVEVLADRAARSRAGVPALVRALGRLVPAGEGEVGATLAAGDGPGAGLEARLGLLLDARPRPVQAALLGALAVAVLAAPTVLVVVPWLTGLPW